MTFWSASNLEPTRKYRFQVRFGGGVVWWAKSVTKPGFEINTNKYTAINHSIEFPGILTWTDVTLTVVDVGKKTKGYYDDLASIGYKAPIGPSVAGGIEKKESKSLKIEQVDGEGAAIETWVLHNYIIKSVNFGDLSYDDDGLVELQLTIAYDWAELK